MKVGFISLGCAKNRVDTEIMMGIIRGSDHQLVQNIEQAEAVIINTCGFISEAQEEAVDTILQTAQLKESGPLKYLLAVGCLAQRYGEQLFEEIGELDAVLGLPFMHTLNQVLGELSKGDRIVRVAPPPETFIEKGRRILTTPPGWAYLKIVEGCDNRCSYCAIPQIKGRLRSRPIEELVGEAKSLIRQGVKEITLIGQDTALYGQDLYGKASLSALTERLEQVEGLEWLRLMYLHPAHIDDEIIEKVASSSVIVPYLEVPIQHISDRILKAMGRGHQRSRLEELFAMLRLKIPRLSLRTTVMVGFPGESEDEFTELMEFARQVKFDWLGAFAFQAQEGTRAESLQGQIPEDVKVNRLNLILDQQRKITRRKNISRVQSRQKILVSSQVSKNLYMGRGVFQAPEVDGVTIIRSQSPLKKGTSYDVLLKAVRNYDMIGEINDEPSQ